MAMHPSLDFISEQELTEWIKQHLDSGAKVLSSGYQGKTLLFESAGHCLVIKAPLGNRLTRPINLALLKHEYAVYQALSGLDFIPQCFGMANNEYLVLEFIAGHTIRQNRPDTGSSYYSVLFDAISQMHQRGVAHFDLKRKENLLVTEDSQPVIIDFGVSIIQKSRWHLLNRFLFSMAKQFDLNAWVRHKYDRKYDQVSDQDNEYYNKTIIETMALKTKRFYKDRILKKIFRNYK